MNNRKSSHIYYSGNFKDFRSSAGNQGKDQICIYYYITIVYFIMLHCLYMLHIFYVYYFLNYKEGAL